MPPNDPTTRTLPVREASILPTIWGSIEPQVRKLGLELTAWDVRGHLVAGDIRCELCRRLGKAEMCLEEVKSLAGAAIASGKPSRSRVGGCCLLALPIYQRRRLAGALVGSFPTRQMLDKESRAAVACRFGADEETFAAAATAVCRHRMEQADDFLNILAGWVQRDQANCVAQDELATLSDNLATTYEELALVYKISGSMKVTREPLDFFKGVCDDLREVMNVEAAAAIVHATSDEEEMVVTAGACDLNRDQFLLLASSELAGRIAGNRPILDNHFAANPASGLGRAVSGIIVAPLSNDDAVIGMLVGINKCEGDFNSVDLKLIQSIANQSSLFLNNNTLYADLQELLMGVLHALTASIDAKDTYTCGHSQRVALISRRLAEQCGLAPDRVQQIYLSGLLHDVGKIGVPESVLRKEGRLTPEEFEEIKKHPSLGARILSGIRQLDDVVTGILTHHERPDGRGYPQGLSGQDIPLEGLIVGLADSFDAMTSNRTYRKALPLEAAVSEIRKYAGVQFDANLVDMFIAMDLAKFMEELHQPTRTVFPVSLGGKTR